MVGVLARDRMSIGPLKTLLSSEDGGTVPGAQGHELSTLGHTCTTSCRGVSVSCDGATDVRAVS